MSRVRSPNFPVISLPQAIERIEAIYDKEQTLPATRETLAEHLGYSGLNGASIKMISALGKYGLLEAVDDRGHRVSKLAMAILHPADDQEKMDAIREAASMPALFQRLTEQFDGGRPSETNLRSWLLRNGFAKSAVDNVIRAYGETMDLVGDSRGSYKVPALTSESKAEREPMQAAPVVQVPHHGRVMQPAEPFSVEFAGGRIRLVGELSNQEDARTLLDYLKAAVAFLPAKKTDAVNQDRGRDDFDDL